MKYIKNIFKTPYYRNTKCENEYYIALPSFIISDVSIKSNAICFLFVIIFTRMKP